MVAGSIFTFSLTLGDYITPDHGLADAKFIGDVIFDDFEPGDLPLAAAYSLIPIQIMIGRYLSGQASGRLRFAVRRLP